MELYLNVDKVPGEVTEAEHKQWIKIHDFNYSVFSESVEDPSDRGKLVSASGRYSVIAVSKDSDTTSPLLQQIASKGDPIATVKIHGCLDSQQKIPQLEIELTNVVICGYSIAAASGGNAMDQVQFRYAKIKVTHRNFDEKGGKKSEPSFTWDLLTKKPA